MKEKTGIIVQWIVAIVVSFFFINIVTFPLYHSIGWINVAGAPTTSISEPNQIIVCSGEGYGINRMDANGYANPSTQLSKDGYVLAMGSSITKASQVMGGKNYVSILNRVLGGNENSLKVYNIGQDGATFSSMSKCFEAAVNEYVDAEAITMEFCILGVTEQDLENGFLSNGWNAKAIEHIDLEKRQQLKFAIKRYFPLVSFVMESRLPKIDFTLDGAFGIDNSYNVLDEQENSTLADYETYFRNTLSFMREQYSQRIILVYIPAVELDNEGMYAVPKPEIELLLKIAPEYNIEVLDASEIFLEAYQKDYTFPLGYWNTHYGAGHMNKSGHQLIAEKLYEMLGE